ncbi:CPBP family intramembrane metalloprotease [Alkalihalobacillus sp. LMS6]|uniref:CPBP family intramembrane glutamic endopeptidase n=1 Tax=Alkalihalobacillus sp. LMS6 TaxID=2924034 RepID=UPI0020D19265|nr:type II CAAX endopeptidase family protein [Alkalihalobacillus sp. LMS6]UTR05696.1 CPBP family intramembrane metalloprotease [Alkalihalobacillus sp. LMS6]
MKIIYNGVGILFFVIMQIAVAFTLVVVLQGFLNMNSGLSMILSVVLTIGIALVTARMLIRNTLTMRYALVVFAYIVMQTGLALVASTVLQSFFGVTDEALLIGVSSILSFSVGLVAILLILRRDEQLGGGLRGTKITPLETVSWSIIGVFLVFGTQIVAGLIQTLIFGIDQGSENTEDLVAIAQEFLPFIIVIAVIGPIIEELVFRKAIFGWLYVRTNFWIAGLISSVIFAVIHFDFQHILIYGAMGFAFAFLYVKTKRIIVPIIAHIALNSFVVIVQVLLIDDINEMMDVASFIYNMLGMMI